MYFRNQNTDAVTEQDESLLLDVCTILKSQFLTQAKAWETNLKWQYRSLNCHSMVRMMSILFDELTVIDGTLIGLEVDVEAGKVKTKKTNHSWLETPDGNIIDPYPMGIIATTCAILIPTSKTQYTIHAGNLYVKGLKIDGEFDIKEAWKIARSRLRANQKYLRNKLDEDEEDDEED
jgi:hypothetical protein